MDNRWCEYRWKNNCSETEKEKFTDDNNWEIYIYEVYVYRILVKEDKKKTDNEPF